MLGGGRADARTQLAGIAVAFWLLALFALLPTVPGLAQERAKTPAPGRLWKAYPLNPQASPSAQPVAASATARTKSGPVAVSSPAGGGAVPAVFLGLLALLGAGGTMTFLQRRRHREPEPSAAPALRASRLVAASANGRSGRFARATTRSLESHTVGALATAASAGDPGRGSDPAPAAKPARGNPSPAAPVAAPTVAPPDPTRAWTAEIEWRHAESGSRFCVVAHGAGTMTLAQSAPLEWPPVRPAAVQAMTEAPEELAGALVAAGWKALPPGSAWYAKRFSWEPAGAAAGQPGAKASSPLLRRPALRIALLCVLIALGPLAALLLHGGGDQAPAVKPAPSANAAKPAGSGGIDLTIPIVVVLGGVAVALAIRQTRRPRQ